MGITAINSGVSRAPSGVEDASCILLHEDQIAERVRELGLELTAVYKGKDPIFVAVMQGAVVFFADLVRQVQLELVCDFVSISSYAGGSQPAGQPKLLLPPREDWAGRHVVFVEAIVDTGWTAKLLEQIAVERRAATANLCTLLNKPSRRRVEVRCDFVGFTIEDLFVVGYGLDFGGPV